MKILHTSDWHLGHSLYNYDRSEEQSQMLEQMERIVESEKPDVFLLSGDVYHTTQPSSATQTMFTNAMVRIHEAHPDMVIVVTAGNHDSGAKHDIFQTPWRALKVFTVGTLEKEQPDNHIIHIKGKGYIVAIPYSYERNIPDGFFQGLLDEVSRRNTGNLPVVMMAHTTIKGCDFTGHDQTSSIQGEYTIGGIDGIELSQIGTGYDYLALGHIHHAQFVHGGEHRVRYCGSPLAVSFDETYEHSISIVNIDAHGASPEVKTINIENPHPLVSLPSSGTCDWEEALEKLKDFPKDIAAYIRLNVEVDDFLPVEANAEAIKLTEDKACKFCYINTTRKARQQSQHHTMTISEFQAESPINIMRQYANDMDVELDEELEQMFMEACRESEHTE